MPEISVIVPVYNVEAYLPQCIDSILAQTFTDFELILVDDGSPDNCPAICDAYAQQDSRARVIHQKNQGVSVARNAGLDWMFVNSDSTWVSFVDSDDWVHPKYLEYLHRAVIENQTSISVCKDESFEGSDNYTFKEEEYCAHCESSVAFLKKGNMLTAWGKMYHKEIFRHCRFPMGKICEDAFVIPPMLYEAGRIGVIEAPNLYAYRIRNGSIMRTTSPQMLDRIEAHEVLCRYYRNKEKELYQMYLYKLVCASGGTLISLCKYPEYATEVKRIRRRHIKALWVATREGAVSFEEDVWLYELAYPRLMTLYWWVQAAKKKIQRLMHRGKNEEGKPQ